MPAWRFLNLVHVTWRHTLPDDPGREGMFTKEDLDKVLLVPFTQTGTTAATETSADEPDEWTVEGLTPPPWWKGDEEASLSGLQVRSA